MIDPGLTEERTELAWERTAIATMIVGLLIARAAAMSLHWAFGIVGLLGVLFGSGLLVWAGRCPDDLNDTTATRVVATGTLLLIAASTVLAVVIALN